MVHCSMGFQIYSVQRVLFESEYRPLKLRGIWGFICINTVLAPHALHLSAPLHVCLQYGEESRGERPQGGEFGRL